MTPTSQEVSIPSSVDARPPVWCEWIHECRDGMDAKERPWGGRSSR